MDIESTIKKLHRLERKVLPYIKDNSTLKNLSKESGLKTVEVMRALQWLANKQLITLTQSSQKLITLDSNGLTYLKEGMPERRLLNSLGAEKIKLDQVREKARLDNQELSISMGYLKSRAAISIQKDNGILLSITDNGRNMLDKKTLEEKFLESVDEGRIIAELKPEEKHAYENLIKRKDMLKTVDVKLVEAKLTQLGREILKKGISNKDVADRLTHSMLKTGSWKKQTFREYDIKINVPKVYGGRSHFVNQAIDYVKRIWIELGFKEMTGPLIQTSFWNFDALFTAQDHPVREMQDTYFIKNPKKGKLVKPDVVKRVKKTHEDGWTTGSTGWQYKWDPEEARKNVLRTHTTCLSARYIANLTKKDLPAKFFAVGKNFRNETLDWSHLFELIQVEGIVVDQNANFRNLIGYLKNFFLKMGYPKVRVRPGYFPYTEPSAEVDVFHPLHKKWMELGGSGMFRPEMTKPLFGTEVPVLAWGLGFDRTIMEYFGMKDIRDLYRNDLKQIKEAKIWLK